MQRVTSELLEVIVRDLARLEVGAPELSGVDGSVVGKVKLTRSEPVGAIWSQQQRVFE